MSEWSDGRLRLAEYLTGLRTELSRSRAEADKDDLKFDVDVATLEVDIAYSLARSEEPEFWVLAPAQQEARDEPGSANRDRQRLTVRLTPWHDAASGRETSEPVSATLPDSSSPEGQ
ncbi:trypco2 family protein [Streptosporangium sp. NBC_01469]|uniref:trypco2 family protein n=1 Tax=Streptosporangium sp. NBC_01469 TaxID=2903898 RepID=UPI002E291CEB|nr:trypco2 family protein [Streptosporangium sp. NBC_01469]